MYCIGVVLYGDFVMNFVIVLWPESKIFCIIYLIDSLIEHKAKVCDKSLYGFKDNP